MASLGNKRKIDKFVQTESKLVKFKDDKCIIHYYTDEQFDTWQIAQDNVDYTNFFESEYKNLKDVAEYFNIEFVNVDTDNHIIVYSMKKYPKILLDEIHKITKLKLKEYVLKLVVLWENLVKDGYTCHDLAFRNIAIDENDNLQFIDIDSFSPIDRKRKKRGGDNNSCLVYLKNDLKTYMKKEDFQFVYKKFVDVNNNCLFNL